MRISFDIDDTLICHRSAAATEVGRLPWFILRRVCEPLRLGACSLLRELRRRGCDVWVYTSSERTAFEIRLWLLFHGVQVEGVVNAERHRRELSSRRFSRLPSKYPPAFGIDLHVDDSEGVLLEGNEFGFRVVVVHPDDEAWTQKVLVAVAGIRNLTNARL